MLITLAVADVIVGSCDIPHFKVSGCNSVLLGYGHEVEGAHWEK